MAILLVSGAVALLPLRAASAAPGSASDPVTTLTSPDAQYYGAFGSSVAISGNTAVVGAWNETADGYLYAGHAYVFNAQTGALIATLTSPNAQEYGSFGGSVAISGSTVVVGAPRESAGLYTLAGHAYVFNAQTGALMETLTSPNAQYYGAFGYSVAISGSTVVVGAYCETALGISIAGRAYVFNAQTGALIATLTSNYTQPAGYFGDSVAISGSTTVVGAWGEAVDGYPDAGLAYVFNAQTGARIAMLTSPNAQPGGYFGSSVAIDGNTAVVGATGEAVAGYPYGYPDAGLAYAFNAQTGALIATLTSPNAQTGAYFGVSVAIDGNTAVVGAPDETAGGYLSAGNAYAFNAQTGALMETLTSPNAQEYGWFGWSVAIDGNTAVVSTYGETAGGYSRAGHAYVFNARTGALTLTSPNAQTTGYFGMSVAIDGNTTVVGAYDETFGGYSEMGHAYVFNAQTGALTLTSPNAQAYGYFGSSVAIDGNTVVVGADGETVGGYSDTGHVYVFNAQTGALIATLNSPNAQYGGYFGYSVAISGNTVVVGAYYETFGGYSWAGHAYVFNARTGALTKTLTSPNAQAGGWFGYSVAIDGNTVVVGAPDETVGGYSEAGHAYVFNATSGALMETLTSPNVQEYGWFGESVAISGNTAVVGAIHETAGGYSDAGHVYVFNAQTGALMETLTSPNAQYGGWFGNSLAIDGSTTVVSAYDETVAGYSDAGHAYVFNAQTGALIAMLTSPDAQFRGYFGESVAISGSTVVAGAFGEFVGGYSGAGNAYVFSNVFTVTQPVTATFVSTYGGSPQTVTITGSCNPFPSTFPGDGNTQNILMFPNCSFDLSLPSGYQFVGTPTGTTTCASGTCTAFTISYQATVVAASCKPASVTVGKHTTCTATVTPYPGNPKPSGYVDWSAVSGTWSPASCKLSSKGSCSVHYTPTTAGSIALTASYTYSGSTNIGNFTLTSTPKPTKTTVSCTPSSVAAGSSTTITCTATVKGYGVPTGSVSWTQSSTNGGSVTFTSSPATCTLNGQGSCTATMTGTTAGKVTITAAYGGDTNNAGSSKTAKVTVKKAKTTLALSCTGSGTSWSCTATLSGFAGTVTGEPVTFSQSGTGKVTFTPASGWVLTSSETCTVSLTATKAGSVTIKASYAGDSNNLKSSATATVSVT
jgi:hypothetical protein